MPYGPTFRPFSVETKDGGERKGREVEINQRSSESHGEDERDGPKAREVESDFEKSIKTSAQGLTNQRRDEGGRVTVSIVNFCNRSTMVVKIVLLFYLRKRSTETLPLTSPVRVSGVF